MPYRKASPGQRREQFAVKRTLNSTNRRQTAEVKKKLQTLRTALEAEIKKTRDPDTAARLQEIVNQVVSRLEVLENQDEEVQCLEEDLIRFDADQWAKATAGQPAAAQRYWRAGEPA